MTIKRIIFSFPPIEIFLFDTKNLSLSLSLSRSWFILQKEKEKNARHRSSIIKHDSYCSFFRTLVHVDDRAYFIVGTGAISYKLNVTRPFLW